MKKKNIEKYELYSIEALRHKPKSNILISATPIYMHETFNSMEELKKELPTLTKKLDDEFVHLYIIEIDENNNPCGIAGVIYGDEEGNLGIDCAEWDERVLASVAFNEEWVRI